MDSTMKTRTLFLLAVLCSLCAACGSDDEPTAAVVESQQLAAGEYLGNTDVCLNGDGVLTSPSGNWVISKCAESVALEQIGVQDVLMSLNKKMSVSAGHVYALVEASEQQHFKSGKVAVKYGTDVCFVRVDELEISDSRATAMRYSSIHRTALRGSLPEWDDKLKCQRYQTESWYAEVPITGAEMMSLPGITITANNLSKSTRFTIASQGAGLYTVEGPVTGGWFHRINALAYIRQGTVFTQVRLVD